MRVIITDGGRKAAGFRGEAPGDCVTRAIAIAAQLSYREVYDALNERAEREAHMRGRAGARAACGLGSNARTGVLHVTWRPYLQSLGFQWTPTMRVGRGCTVHLRDGELPERGRLIAKVSKHLCAVIDGVVHDTYDPTREGTRCVYGYWSLPT